MKEKVGEGMERVQLTRLKLHWKDIVKVEIYFLFPQLERNL
jgi:hypothetical protein